MPHRSLEGTAQPAPTTPIDTPAPYAPPSHPDLGFEPLDLTCAACGQVAAPTQNFCVACGSALSAPCPVCGAVNRADQRSCSACGQDLLVSCRACGSAGRAGQRFCGECGAELTSTAAAIASATEGPPAGAPEIPAPGSRVEEERRLITAIFCDLVGFTPLTESLDAEEVREIQTMYFTQMSRELHRFGGSVEKYAGDAVLALFGVPVAHEDDPERAVRCALAMQQAFQPVAEMAKREWGATVALRIGVNTGELVSGSWDIEGRVDYSATGDALNTAARLQTSCEPGGVIVGQQTMLLARRAIIFGPRQDLTLKGKSEPFPAYSVIGLRAQLAERWETREERTPLVGRESEMAQLAEAWERALGREGGVVTLVAEAGVGKSRLVAEAVERMSAVAGTVVIRGRCLSFGETVSLHLVADLLRSVCQVPEGAGQDEIRGSVRTAVDSLLAGWDAETRDAAADVLGSVLGLPPSESPVTNAGPQVRRQVLVRGLRLLLRALSSYRPLIVLLEDLHWADSASIEVLESVLPELQEYQGLVLSARRPGEPRPWESWPRSVVMPLEPLDGSDAGILARSLLGGVDLAPELERVIGERAAGNPFFVEELLQSMQETGALEERDGRLGLVPGAAERLPSTLTELLMARLDQLDRPSRSAAQHGSVIGRSFAVPLLSLVSEQPEDALRAPLDVLERAEIALPRNNPEQEYVFKHAALREVAYNALLLRKRRALHAATARSIIHLYPADEHVEIIAYHFSQTREHGEAATWLERAGDRAAGIFANAEAIAHYREARQRQEKVGATADARARIDEKLGHILRVAIRFDEGLAALDAALEGYRVAGDLEGARRVSAEIGRLHRAQGTPEDGVARVDQALSSDSAGPPTSGLAALHVAQARLYYNLGRYQEELIAAGRGAELARLLGDRRVLSEAEMSRSVALYHLRQTADAVRIMESAIPIAEEVEDFEVLAILLGNVAMIHRDTGDFESSRLYRDRSAHLAERVGDSGWHAMALANLGELVFCLGEWDEARTILQQGHNIVRSLDRSWFSSQAPAYLGQVYAAQGAFDLASACLGEALEISREGGNHLLLILPLAFLAEMEMLRGRPETAVEYLSEIMGLSGVIPEDATLTGILPFAASALLDTGQVGRAAELAALGVERATEEGATVEIMMSLRVLGAAATAQGDFETARDAFERAHALIAEMTFPYAEARILYEHGRMQARCGNGIEARRLLEAGLTIFTRLGAQPYIERTRAALAQVQSVR